MSALAQQTCMPELAKEYASLHGRCQLLTGLRREWRTAAAACERGALVGWGEVLMLRWLGWPAAEPSLGGGGGGGAAGATTNHWLVASFPDA